MSKQCWLRFFCLDIKIFYRVCCGAFHCNTKLTMQNFVLNFPQVYCDQDTDGGGWIVFQRRQDGSINFYRDWSSYETGFGDIEGEFWLGNNNIHQLTAECCHELRIDLEDSDGNQRYAKYDSFIVASKSSNYKLTVGAYTGDAGDSLGYHNRHQFSTKERDNDVYEKSCSHLYKRGLVVLFMSCF